MKDKVSEFKEMLNKNKAQDKAKSVPVEDGDAPKSIAPDSSKDQGPENLQAVPDSQEDQVAQLEAQIQEHKKAAETQRNMYLEKLAEFENFRKRLSKEQEESRKFAIERVLEEFLPILDNLEMTLTHAPDKKDPIVQGVDMTLKLFIQTLGKFGVQEVSGVGEKFDPNKQEAIGTEDHDTIASDHVTQVHRKGYLLNGKLVRPAMVTVAK